jgi:hypothetical protein
MPLRSVPDLNSNRVRAYCINLDRRPDRWEQAQREWAKFSDVPENLFRVKAVDTGSAAGCGISHQLCVDDARRKGFGFVLVLEDDFVFKPDVRELWREQIGALRAQDQCDLFRPGLSGLIASTKLAPPLYRIHDSSGLFITLYFESSYNTVLQWRPENGPIDRWLSSHPQLVTISAVPFLATTSNGLSNIRNTEVKDSEVIALTEALLSAQPERAEAKLTLAQPVRTQVDTDSKVILGSAIRTTDGRIRRMSKSMK